MPEIPRPLALRLLSLDGSQTIGFVEVEGDLSTSDGNRWSSLLLHIIEDGATGLAIDLRGCEDIDGDSLEALLAASATLVARGGNGAAVVAFPGSELRRRVRHEAGEGLPVYDGASDAIRALRAPPP